VDLALAPVVRVRIPGPEGVRGSSWETLKPKRRWKVRAVAVFDDDCQMCCSTTRGLWFGGVLSINLEERRSRITSKED
jgi:hypothetical protein